MLGTQPLKGFCDDIISEVALINTYSKEHDHGVIARYTQAEHTMKASVQAHDGQFVFPEQSGSTYVSLKRIKEKLQLIRIVLSLVRKHRPIKDDRVHPVPMPVKWKTIKKPRRNTP